MEQLHRKINSKESTSIRQAMKSSYALVSAFLSIMGGLRPLPVLKCANSKMAVTVFS